MDPPLLPTYGLTKMKIIPLFLPHWSIVDVLFKDGWIVIDVSDVDLDPGRGGGLTGPWGQLTSGLSGGHLEVMHVHELTVDLPPGWYQVTNSIIFCWLFTIKDRCKKVRFQQTYNQGLRQLFLTVSWDLHTFRDTPDGVLLSL